MTDWDFKNETNESWIFCWYPNYESAIDEEKKESLFIRFFDWFPEEIRLLCVTLEKAFALVTGKNFTSHSTKKSSVACIRVGESLIKFEISDDRW